MFVGIIQAAFNEGHLAEECAYQIFILIPKRGGDFRGIGLADVM